MDYPALNETSRYIFWETLHGIDPKKKDRHWFAEALYFAKANSHRLLDPEKARKTREANRGIVEADEYRRIFDPIMEDGTGGKAEYFAADWKADPIFVHLDNIISSNLEKIPKGIYVKAADELSKLKMQKDNDKILTRKYVADLINEMNGHLGLPPLGKNEDPYTYINKMDAGAKAKSNPVTMVDSIKNAIADDEDLALYNEYIYKDGVEIAMELGIDYYFNENKFDRISEKIIDDIKNFNRACVRYYTSETTGRPVFLRYDPSLVWTSKFEKNDGSDIIFWHIEWDISFSDFLRMFGADLQADAKERNVTEESVMQEIFDLNRRNLGSNLFWAHSSKSQRDNARIRVGYMEMESQDMEVYSDRMVRGNNRYSPADDVGYTPSKDAKKKYSAKRDESHYNVWYKGWYIPFMNGTGSRIQTSDFELQSKYVFKFGKVQDQQREGDDFKYAKSSLVLWNSEKMSFFDIMNAYMPKMNILWFHFQNNLAQAMPNGVIWANEIITTMVDATDDAAKDGKDSKFEMARRIKQTGYGMADLFDENGRMKNGGVPFVNIKTNHLEAAATILVLMQDLYNKMRQALGQNDVSEGAGSKPRVSLGAVQISNEASQSATFFIEKGFMDIVLESARRLMYYFKNIVENNDEKRLADFTDVVGRANSMALESIKDIPLHRLGLNIQSVLTDKERDNLVRLAESLAAAGQLDPDVAIFLTTVDNLKYGQAILRLRYKQKQKEIAAQQAQQQQNQMQLKQADLQVELAKIQAKGQAEFNMEQMMKQWDYKIEQLILGLKSQAADNNITLRGQNKSQEEILKSQLRQKEEQEKPLV